jgi:hypothetical protein
MWTFHDLKQFGIIVEYVVNTNIWAVKEKVTARLTCSGQLKMRKPHVRAGGPRSLSLRLSEFLRNSDNLILGDHDLSL